MFFSTPWLVSMFLPALIVAAAAAVTYALLYAATKKTAPPTKKLLFTAAFFGYIFLVINVTILFRPPVFGGSIELNPFASYLRALRATGRLNYIEIRNLVLNVAMFVPLGILLPAAHKSLRKFYITMPIVMLATIAIETTQLLTHRGIFATEDILHNAVGGALGYLFFKIFKKP